MKSLLIAGTVFAAALTIAAPVWAQASLTAEELNREELNHLTTSHGAPVVVVPSDQYPCYDYPYCPPYEYGIGIVPQKRRR